MAAVAALAVAVRELLPPACKDLRRVARRHRAEAARAQHESARLVEAYDHLWGEAAEQEIEIQVQANEIIRLRKAQSPPRVQACSLAVHTQPSILLHKNINASF
jgi:hypothetical protein